MRRKKTLLLGTIYLFSNEVLANRCNERDEKFKGNGTICYFF